MHQNMHQRIPSFSSSEHFFNKSFILLVPGGGVEPPRPCDRRILSPLRLPVPPSRRISILSVLLHLALWPQAPQLVGACNRVERGQFQVVHRHP
jgi:hypothetical protein